MLARPRSRSPVFGGRPDRVGLYIDPDTSVARGADREDAGLAIEAVVDVGATVGPCGAMGVNVQEGKPQLADATGSAVEKPKYCLSSAAALSAALRSPSSGS